VDVEEAPRLEPLEGRGAARARAPRRAAERGQHRSCALPLPI
jgi:hypothetical protein